MAANSEAVETAADASWFAYYGQDGCAEEYNLIGYLAQPLYGVWASAPYFHNGSVPTVWGVLDSSTRPLFWRRMSKPAARRRRHGLRDGPRARLRPGRARVEVRRPAMRGARGHAVPQMRSGAIPYATPLVESWLSILFANGSLAWNILGTVMAPTLTNAQIEDRKIYNTRMHSQSNSGHEFTDVLTDAERTALIEYLKTL